MLSRLKGFLRTADSEKVVVPGRYIQVPTTKAEQIKFVAERNEKISKVKMKPTKVKPFEEKVLLTSDSVMVKNNAGKNKAGQKKAGKVKTVKLVSGKTKRTSIKIDFSIFLAGLSVLSDNLKKLTLVLKKANPREWHFKLKKFEFKRFEFKRFEFKKFELNKFKLKKFELKGFKLVNFKFANLKLKPIKPIKSVSTKFVDILDKVKIIFKGLFSNIKLNDSTHTGTHPVRIKALIVSCSFILVAVLAGSVVASSYTFAYEVFVDDAKVGVVADKKEVETILGEIKDDLVKCAEQGIDVEKTPVYNQVLVPKDEFTNKTNLRANVMDQIPDVVEAFTILVDDVPMTSHETKEIASSVLEAVKEPYVNQEGLVSIDFDKTVKIIKEYVPSDSIIPYEEAVQYYGVISDVEHQYTVVDGENWWTIARDHSMTMEQLMALNPSAGELLQIGQKLNIVIPTSVLGVKTVSVISYENTIPFTTTRVNDPDLASGTSKVETEGEDGVQRVEAEITAINGVETEKKIIKEETLSLPVEKVIKVGAGNTISSSSVTTSGSGSSVKGSGSFGMPTYGTITSRFGYRGRGYHYGLDIANSTGTPIRACDSGTVTLSRWNGNFGYCVIIDHGNGYETLYAHNSKLYVSAGQKVSKGQQIAAMGSTGNSTGPHCHLEIRKNGVRLNPANYIY